MKLHLSFKFFTAFLMTSMLIVISMILTMNIFIFHNFSDYVNRVELEKLDKFVDSLKTEYEKSGSWKHIAQHPFIFMETFRTTMLGKNFSRDFPMEPLFDHPPLPNHDDEPGKKRDRGKPDPMNHPFGHPPPRPDEKFAGKMPGPGDKHFEKLHDPVLRNLMRTGSRLSLFDEKKHPVFEKQASAEKYTLREIVSKEKTAGWIGLRKEENLSNPLDAQFLRSQEKLFYLMGGIILIPALLVSFFLARHLLAPIRELAKGTQALTSFRFDTTIAVRSKDELGQLALDFNRMAQTLKKYEEMRRQWISDISHELRTPLAILRGEIEAMQDGIRKMDGETLDSLHAEVLRINRLVDDLHLLSLADSRNLDIRKDSINPMRILQRTAERFRSRFSSQNIAICFDPQTCEDMILIGDEERLEHVFCNLLENTLRYTDSPGELHIRSGFSEKEIFFVFEDSAPGVPDESLERLFDRLYRVDKSRSRVMGGSGLGLSICKEIVESHRGKISAEHSSVGGLKIKIVFPHEIQQIGNPPPPCT